MGLAPVLVEQIFVVIREIQRRGATILLVEQNAWMALSVADRGYVIESGRVVHEGSAAEVREEPALERAYLGDFK